VSFREPHFLRLIDSQATALTQLVREIDPMRRLNRWARWACVARGVRGTDELGEISATLRTRAGTRSICARPEGFAQAQHQRLTRPKEAK